MRCSLAVGQVLALALASAAFAQAQGTDPLHSPDCDAARAVLESALKDASAKLPGATARLAAARKEAIGICLGRDTGERKRVGAPDPPIAVAPPVIEVPRSTAPAAATPATPPPVVVIPRPTVITSCDAGGCWDSNGQRLNNLGPMLVGPRGACTMQAGLAQCP